MKDEWVIIPARSGSKGVKDKNIANIGGKPLLQHAIETTLKYFDREKIIVSTDSQCYMEIALRLGLKDFGLRPEELSSGEAHIKDVVIYEMSKLVDIGKVDPKGTSCFLIEPSHFSLRPNIAEARKIMKTGDYNSVVSLVPVPNKYHYNKQYFIDSTGDAIFIGQTSNINRQSLTSSYIRSGELYAFNLEAVMQCENLQPSPTKSLILNGQFANIDEPIDLDEAIKIWSEE
ncbi:cytidylyltransferase domain-containing protein [Litoribacillus peritrichatus]|uniref:CMP-N,N'-diacetyllegionaminic acid synthase n=1 Tax=Litoribacillus peritrichatus TaxID=718191 RepID=A0ABP7LZ57_9GAMM